MSVTPDDPSAGLTRFFEYIWGEVEGFVYLPTKNRDTESWRKVMFEWPKHKPAIVRHVEVSTAEGLDVYYAPGVFNDMLSAKRDNVKGSSVVWVDYDGNAPQDWTPETFDVPIVAPSLRIQSSVDGHEHVYWKLDEFTTDVKFIEDTNRALAYTTKADTSGWDLGQVLRPPYTTNYKNNDPVTIAEESSRKYKSVDFGTLQPVKQLVSDALDVDELPEITRVIATYQWDKDHYELFMRADVPQGERSSALMRLGFFGAELGMQDAEIYAVLLHADDRWGKFRNRSDRKRRLLDIINKARQKHPVGLSSPEGLLRAASSSSDIISAPRYVYGFESLINAEFHVEWAIEGLLEIGGIGVISSAPGVGKTQISMQLGIHAALGKEFLGWKMVRPLKMLMFSLEMNRVTVKSFSSTMGAGYTPSELQALERNFNIVTLGETMPLDHPDGRKFFESLLNEYHPDGVIIDSMGKLTHASLSDEAKVKQLNAYYVQIRNRYDCFIWLIHHNRKATDNNKKPNSLADIYGSQYIAAEASVVLSAWKNGDVNKTIEISSLKVRLAPEGPPFNIRRDSTLNFYIAEAPVGQGLLNAATSSGHNDAGPDESPETVFNI